MTDGINAVASIEIYGIEVDDEVVEKLLKDELSAEKILELVYEGISGNRMELRILSANVTAI